MIEWHKLENCEDKMKAVLLIGGEGTRLRPLTCNVTKAMVPILNRPFLEHAILYFKKHGVEEIILAMGYLPDAIEAYFGDGKQFGVHLTYSVEESPLGTAGAVKNAEAYLDQPFLVFNGDVLTEVDLTEMIKRHREAEPKVSIALTPVENPTIYGVVETDVEGMVKRFVEKPSWDKVTTNMINAGIYILEPEVLELIPASTYFMFEHNVFPPLLEKGDPMLSYPSDAYWIDIGTPEKYLTAHHDLLSAWGDAIRTDGESQIDPTAQIEGPVLIGESCIIGKEAQVKGPAVLGPGCKIAEGAVIEGAVIWHNSKVDKGAVLRNCIVCAHCHVRQDSQVLDNCVIGDKVTVGTRNKLAADTKVWPEECVEPNVE